MNGLSDLDPTTPIEIYGESFAIVNNASRALPDTVLLFYDGRLVHRFSGEQEVRVVLKPDVLAAGDHTLTLRGVKTLNGVTKEGEDRREVRLERP